MIRADNIGRVRVVLVAMAIGLACAYATAQDREKPTKAGEETLTQPPAALPSALDKSTTTPEIAVKDLSEDFRTSPALSIVLGFFRDRALDLCDLFRFRLHVSNGFRSIGFKARGTCLAQVGFIYADGKSIGIDRRGAGIWRERRSEAGVGPVYFSRVSSERVAGNRYTNVRHPWSRMYRRGIVRNGVFWDDGRLHPLSGGAELQLFIFGLEFEAYPLEGLDAAIGWVGLDPFNDDDSRILRRWHQWQTIPELKLHDEWQETYKPAEKVAPAPGKNKNAGIKIEMPSERKPPEELPIAEPEKKE
jgi:hypothetical protein